MDINAIQDFFWIMDFILLTIKDLIKYNCK